MCVNQSYLRIMLDRVFYKYQRKKVNMTGRNIGYTRVSSGKKETLQLEGVKLDKTFTDNGLDWSQLENCLNYLKKNDTLHIQNLNKIAVNLRDLQEITDGLICKDVTIKFHTENLIVDNNDNPISNLTRHIIGAFAEFEKNSVEEKPTV